MNLPGDPPSVLFVDQTGQLGGAELMLLDVAAARRHCSHVVLFDDGPFRQRLEERGVSVEVLCAGRAVQQHAKSGGLLRQARSAPAVLRQVHRLARIARRFDVVHANTQKAFVVAALAAALARRPVIYHLHDILTSGHFSTPNRRAVVALANRLAARVVCNSKATLDAFVEAGGRRDKTVIVYNGIDAAPLEKPDPAEVDRLRDQHVREDAFTVGIFGRLTAWKGQHVLLEALEQIDQNDGRPIDALVVGEALFTEEDRAYAEDLEKQAKSGVLAGCIKLLGFHHDVAPLMHACDAVVHCSTQPEPFGRVVVEAMLCGRPVVAAAAGGVPEIIAHGETGLLTPPADPAALAAALHRLRTDPALADRLAQAGRKAARQRFPVHKMLNDLERVIRQVTMPQPRDAK